MSGTGHDVLVPRLSRRDDALITASGRLVEARSRPERRLGVDLEARCDLPHAWSEVLVRLGRSEADRFTVGSLAEPIGLTTGTSNSCPAPPAGGSPTPA